MWCCWSLHQSKHTTKRSCRKDTRLADQAVRIADLEAWLVDQVSAHFLKFRWNWWFNGELQSYWMNLNLEFLIFLLFLKAGFCTLYLKLSQAQATCKQWPALFPADLQLYGHIQGILGQSNGCVVYTCPLHPVIVSLIMWWKKMTIA